jgi:hypothetical protein
MQSPDRLLGPAWAGALGFQPVYTGGGASVVEQCYCVTMSLFQRMSRDVSFSRNDYRGFWFAIRYPRVGKICQMSGASMPMRPSIKEISAR